VAGVGNVPAGVTAVALNLTEAIDLAVAGGPVSLIADIYGYFSSAPASSYMPVTPFRRLDTRKSAGAALPGGDAYLVAMDQGLGRLDPNAVLTGIVVNSTVTQTTASGYLTVFPDNSDDGQQTAVVPNTSTLNFTANNTVANLGFPRSRATTPSTSTTAAAAACN